ncbi:MAG: aminotransferase class I/II-fold pyridoxal phosphate-dependent enzyme [Muricoprocola sp.]
MKNLFEQLEEYANSVYYPFHMPGHKRNLELIREMQKQNREVNLYGIDITEIDGFDNLHHAEGVLKEAQERAALLYGAKKSYYLVNGSTCGILAAVFACTEDHGKILMARNCHKAVYHAVELRHLSAKYLYPDTVCLKDKVVLNGVISPEEVERALKENEDIQVVFLTSPTYDGIVSDIEKIAKIVHRFGKPLIVDEAHGAHFGFHPYFPESALTHGADIVIQSFHKTLPSLTQTAVLHVGKDSLADPSRIQKYLGMFETSSPSYVFMAGMDLCIELLQEKGDKLFSDFVDKLQNFRKKMEKLEHIHLVSQKELSEKQMEMDPSKLVIAAENMDGNELAEYLRKEYFLEVEMAAAGYVLALTSIADTQEGFDRLYEALENLDQKMGACPSPEAKNQMNFMKESDWKMEKPESICKISEAAKSSAQIFPLGQAAGKISGEYVYLYPPGIPLVVPGERISEKMLERFLWYQSRGFSLQGMEDYEGKNIRCLHTFR